MKRSKQAESIHADKEQRVDELLRACAAYSAAKRGIPGCIVRNLVFLRRHWGKRTIPACVRESVRLIEREFDKVPQDIGIVRGRSHVGVTANWEVDER